GAAAGVAGPGADRAGGHAAPRAAPPAAGEGQGLEQRSQRGGTHPVALRGAAGCRVVLVGGERHPVGGVDDPVEDPVDGGRVVLGGGGPPADPESLVVLGGEHRPPGEPVVPVEQGGGGGRGGVHRDGVDVVVTGVPVFG